MFRVSVAECSGSQYTDIQGPSHWVPSVLIAALTPHERPNNTPSCTCPYTSVCTYIMYVAFPDIRSGTTHIHPQLVPSPQELECSHPPPPSVLTRMLLALTAPFKCQQRALSVFMQVYMTRGASNFNEYFVCRCQQCAVIWTAAQFYTRAQRKNTTLKLCRC